VEFSKIQVPISIPKMEERVQIDVGGTLFRINKETLQRYPDTLLGSIAHSSEFNQGDNCFYFDRNPELFNTRVRIGRLRRYMLSIHLYVHILYVNAFIHYMFFYLANT
jgi:hypothetical protein